MNIKLALAALICSVAMSCSVSEGQLLDRMLSKAGCSVCESASAPQGCNTGCDSGCGGGILSGGCGGSGFGGPGILDKIKDRLANVGCGGGCLGASDSCGCVEPVVESSSCGCDAAPSCGCGSGLLDGMKGRLSSLGSGSGCGCNAAPAAGLLSGRLSSLGGGGGCGCEAAPAPAPVVAAPSCGCDAGPSCGGGGLGLLDKMKSGLSSVGGGCAAPAGACGFASAPFAAAAPSCGGGPGLLDRLKGRLDSAGGGGGCGCDAAPVVESCGGGCSAPAPAPFVTPAVEAAPCAAPAGGRIRGAFANIGQSSDCGCGAAPAATFSAAPAVSSCGCGASAGPSSARLTLLDRLRGNRIPRDRDGRVVGSAPNNGCNSPCPSSGGDAGCGCGTATAAPVVYDSAPVDSGCSTCSSCTGTVTEGSIMAAPYAAGGVIYGDSDSTTLDSDSVIMETPADGPSDSTVEPIEKVIEKVQEIPKGTDIDASPTVDPNAFMIRNGNSRG